MRSKQARAGTHALTFQSGVNTKQQLLCHHALRYDKIRLPSHQNDCLPCCFLTEGQALNSSKNRTGKQSAYKLPDPSAHRPVGRFLPWCLSLQPSHTVKRSHLLRKQIKHILTFVWNSLHSENLTSYPRANGSMMRHLILWGWSSQVTLTLYLFIHLSWKLSVLTFFSCQDLRTHLEIGKNKKKNFIFTQI